MKAGKETYRDPAARSPRAGRSFGAFADSMARAVDHLGEADFPGIVDGALRRIVDFDNSMIFAYAPRQRPVAVYTDLADPAEADIVMHKYVLGPYLLDPFFDEVRRGRKNGLAHLGTIAPDEFTKTEYFERHYRRTRITDEIGFFMGLPDDVTAVLSITRRHGAEAFAAADIAALQEVADLVCAVCRRHWSGHGLRLNDPSHAPLDPVEEALLNLRRNTLSDRQAEIIGFLLKGHSTESIALNLDISTETVKVHRRNAYAKLGISSQAELFSIFIEQLSNMIGDRT